MESWMPLFLSWSDVYIFRIVFFSFFFVHGLANLNKFVFLLVQNFFSQLSADHNNESPNPIFFGGLMVVLGPSPIKRASEDKIETMKIEPLNTQLLLSHGNHLSLVTLTHNSH